MKNNQIILGRVYHDGKLGVREVVDSEGGRVQYKILAAKAEKEYRSYTDKMIGGEVRSIIGDMIWCELSSFAVWAKTEVEDVDALLAQLKAGRIKLADGEIAFLHSLGDEYIDCSINYSFTESRQVNSLVKKGVLTAISNGQRRGGQVTLTDIGIAWKKQHPKDVQA